MKPFFADRQGNFGVMTALMMPVLLCALGGVLDLSQQWTGQSVVQRAADAASLAGAKALEAGTEEDAQKAIQDAAKANMPEGFPSVSFVGVIDEAGGTVSVRASGFLTPSFLPLMQIDKLPIDADASSLIQRKSYIDIFLALDVSESMNIAASDTDRKKLEKITKDYNNRPCAFACHAIETWAAPISVYQMNQLAAQRSGDTPARLRIDVLKDAANSMIDKVLALNNNQNSLKSTRVATAGFSSTYQVGMPPSSNATLLKASITNFTNANQHTDMNAALGGLRTQLGTQGKGWGSSDARKFAILITDGVRDTGFSRSELGPLDPMLCDQIKNAGFKLVVLEIKYVARSGEWFFDDRVSWYYNAISPNLSACASPGYYYQATDADNAGTQLMQAIDDILTIRRRLAS